MANRTFNQFRFSLEKATVNLFAHVTFGASGAPTLDVANSKGIASITRNSAGDYTITLQDSYYKFLNVDHRFLNATAPASPEMYVKAQSVGTQGGGTVEVVFNSAGTATDPASGEQVYLTITLGNSSAI